MIHEQVLAILYEMAILIGGETQVRPLLTTALQRLLFHTSFPCGLVFLDAALWRPSDDRDDTLEAKLELSIGDFDFARLDGKTIPAATGLLRGESALGEEPGLIDLFPCRKGYYRHFLRLPIDGQGVILLLGPHLPPSPLPLARIFQPILRNLAKAIVLCRGNEAYTQALRSERAKAEAAFQDLNHRSELILASVGEGICGIDLAGNVTFANPAAERLLGYSAEELAGRPLHSVVEHRRLDGSHLPGEFCPLTLSMREGRQYRSDRDTFRRADGATFPVEYVCSPLLDEGRVLGGVTVFQDITERRAAERELEKLNRALQTLSRCNLTLIGAREETSLLKGITRVLVDVGGHEMVWVGYAEDDAGKSIRPVASAGRDEGYLDTIPLTWSGSCTCPSSLAIRSGEPATIPNIYQGDDLSPWRTEALRRGYAACLSLPLRIEEHVVGALTLFDSETEGFTKDETRLLVELAGDLSFGLATLRTRSERDRAVSERASQVERLRKVAVDTIQAISTMVEIRDPYTAGHQRRVAQLAMAIGREMGLTERRIEGLSFGAQIHDIGKVYVPAEFLSRPGRLTDLELQVIKTHAEAGYSIVKDIDFPWPVAQMIHQHHESLDGSGYPLGLKGEEIVLEARIIAVADAMEAMVSHRPYRPARGIEIALGEVARLREAHYDPSVVDACLTLFRDGRFTFR